MLGRIFCCCNRPEYASQPVSSNELVRKESAREGIRRTREGSRQFLKTDSSAEDSSDVSLVRQHPRVEDGKSYRDLKGFMGKAAKKEDYAGAAFEKDWTYAISAVKAIVNAEGFTDLPNVEQQLFLGLASKKTHVDGAGEYQRMAGYMSFKCCKKELTELIETVIGFGVLDHTYRGWDQISTKGALKNAAELIQRIKKTPGLSVALWKNISACEQAMRSGDAEDKKLNLTLLASSLSVETGEGFLHDSNAMRVLGLMCKAAYEDIFKESRGYLENPDLLHLLKAERMYCGNELISNILDHIIKLIEEISHVDQGSVRARTLESMLSSPIKLFLDLKDLPT